ncbi:MAG: 16S rRNA (cytosine(967)-C(5))-methyltransferase RsmB [Lachnospiraceae bacterium]|nr:16S rRNA (cytosine(967)-C(5))-methyltransferase RsmB [Lachnospiraceae bacterium]
MKKNSDLEIRKIVLEALIQSEKSNIPSHILIKDVLDKYDYLSKNEKALMSTIFKGVIERRIELDYVIDHFSKTPVKKMKMPVRIILEMGVYQILYMNSFDTLAVNTSVELAKKKGFATLSGFVNAVLRNIERNKNDIEYPKKGEKDYLSVKYSIPSFITDLLSEQYDADVLEKMFDASLKNDHLRVRLREAADAEKKNAVIKEIRDKGAEITQTAGFDDLYKVKGVGNISELKSFTDGDIYIQDTGSYILCKNVSGGKNILDACAAPGGKSIFLSERFPDSVITACDVSDEKLKKMAENIERCKVSNVKIKKADATVFNPEWEEYFDVVLCDVPCSGLGVIGKKQDIKYNLSPEGLESLYELQKNILANVSRYVKKDGYLIYSTCTVNKKENEYRVGEFMKNGGFEYSKFAFLPDEYKNGYNGRTLSLIQGQNDSDGFFTAVLKRKSR